MLQIKQSSAVAHFMFLMIDSSDHVTGKTGLTPTVTISKNAAAFASPSGAVTEVSSGWYKLAANATDSNTLGVLALHATGTGADPTDMILANIVAYDPQDTVRLGLTAMPNVASGNAGALLVAGTGTAALNVSSGNVAGSVASVSGAVGSVTSGVNAVQLAGQTITAATGVTFPASVASPTNITAGTITTVTNLTNAPTSGDLTATMKASVNAEVVNALATDTYAEPAQGAPASTATLAAKIGYLYKAWRNKSTQTSSTYSLYADDTTTVDQKATVADDGTTLTRGEIATGP
jgi:hypothetical protein